MAILSILTILCTLSVLTAADPIQSSQQLTYDKLAFQGRPFEPHPLRPKTRYNPSTLALHRDGGNTRSEDFPSPLGHNVKVTTSNITTPSPFLFSENGELTAGATCETPTNPVAACVITMDPDTLEILDQWLLPDDSAYGFYGLTYMTMTGNRILLPGSNVAWELERDEDSKLTLVRTIDLSDIITEDVGALLSIVYDGIGNLWFTSGGFPGAGVGDKMSKAIVGYISPDGRNHTLVLEDQVIENSVAVSGSMIYVNTGPAGKADVANATGYLYTFTSSLNGVEIVQKRPYNAGSAMKAGGFSRGTGSSPNLLGDRFVAMTDNADSQINLLVFTQASADPDIETNTTSPDDPVCKIPLWKPGESANEVTFANNFDGKSTYSLVTTNCYNNPFPLWFPGSKDNPPINGPYNDYNVMGAGVARIDIIPLPNGTVSCGFRWVNAESKTTSINTLSTKTGLMYNYYQDLERVREKGEYEWFVVATDWESGEEVWRVRTGAGGAYNVMFQNPTLSPDGCVYVMVVGGLVRVCDG